MTRTSFIPAVVATLALFCGCSGGARSVRAGMNSVAMGSSVDGGPWSLLGDAEKPKKGSVKNGDSTRSRNETRNTTEVTAVKRDGNVEKVGPVPTASSDGRDKAAAKPDSPVRVEDVGAKSISDVKTPKGGMLMVPASGDSRQRLVRSAGRLVGIRKSFDDRSFLGHVLAINDLLPPKTQSASWKASDQIRIARKNGRFKPAESAPAAGDIVFFTCGKQCGADAADGVGAGVVVDDRSGHESYVAYVDGSVVRVRMSDSKKITGYSAP